MPFPIAVLTGHTGTGDTITAPGCSTVLVKGKPVSCLGDSVSGTACTGVVAQNPNPKVLIKGLPVAKLTAVASGVNPASGVPVETPVAVATAPNVMV